VHAVFLQREPHRHASDAEIRQIDVDRRRSSDDDGAAFAELELDRRAAVERNQPDEHGASLTWNLFRSRAFIHWMHEQRESDDVLMQRVREGDDDAFGEIVDRYKDSLVNYLTHLVRSRDRAEEIAQDAFVRLYRSAANYRERDKLGPYLFRIATNLTVTEIRREKRWSLLLPRLNASTSQHTPPPDANLMTTEIQRQVAAALERLPVKYRAPLVLFEIEEWSYDEIAAALDVRTGTVKSRISRARELMRRHLAPWWTGGTNDERHTTRQFHARASARDGVAGIQV
jgi:RNA polymerase sigma-70 factor, ECF subfamily